MNRRRFLAATGAASALGGGAYWYLTGDGEKTPGNAPNGSNTTSTPFPVGTTSPTDTPGNTPTPAGVNTSTPTPYPTSVDSSTFNLSWIVDVTTEKVTVEMNSQQITNSYPEGAVLVLTALREDETTSSSEFMGRKEVEVPQEGVSRETVNVDTSDLAGGKDNYVVAVLFDSRTQDGSNVTPLALSDRLSFTRDSVARSEHRAYVGGSNTDSPEENYVRYDLPGRYVVILKGKTAGEPWRLTLPFFKQTYNRKVHLEGDYGDFNTELKDSFSSPDDGAYPCEPVVNSTREFLSHTPFSKEDELVFYADIVRSLENAPEYRSGITSYIQHPIETLVTGGGDVRDVSILLSGMTVKSGVRTALIFPKFNEREHMGVGVEGDFTGFSLNLDSTEYYYLEPTNHGSGGVGEADKELKDRSYDFLEYDLFE